MTKIRVNTNEMMKFVNGKKMEESDLCMMLEDLGVVLDKSTWTHFKEVFAKSQPAYKNECKGTIIAINSVQHFKNLLENVLPAGPSSSKAGLAPEDTDSEESDKNVKYGK